MVYVVFTDWRDRLFQPKIIGVYRTHNMAEKARKKIVNDYENDGYENEEQFIVCIEDIAIK